MAEERCKGDCFSLHWGRYVPLASVSACEPGTKEYLGLYIGGVRCWTGVRGSIWKACRGRLKSRRGILDHNESETQRRHSRWLPNATFRNNRRPQGSTPLQDPSTR